jgi:hypothetical protein
MPCFSWLSGTKPASSAPAPSASPANVLADQAKRISQDIQRKRAGNSDEDFNLRVQGFDEDDPVIQAARLERQKSRSQEIERKKREEEEAFQRRLQRV